MVSDLKVREFPLVCTGASVRALLAGEKTQHREPVGDHNTIGNFKASMLDLAKAFVDPGPSPMGNPGPYLKASPLPRGPEYFDDIVDRLYPSVQVGDRLWVRERMCLSADGVWRYECDLRPVRIAADHAREAYPWCARAAARHYARCAANKLPRWASRLTLEVTEVRVQRVQEITDDDVKAEGVKALEGQFAGVYVSPAAVSARSARECFQNGWDEQHYQRGAGWETNPWVIAITFRRVES